MKLNNLKRFLIVVPTTSLILQFYDDLIDYGIDKECIGKFYADEKD
jgi:superfamily II DNA or RNA helicase